MFSNTILIEIRLVESREARIYTDAFRSLNCVSGTRIVTSITAALLQYVMYSLIYSLMWDLPLNWTLSRPSPSSLHRSSVNLLESTSLLCLFASTISYDCLINRVVSFHSSFYWSYYGLLCAFRSLTINIPRDQSTVNNIPGSTFFVARDNTKFSYMSI